VIRERAVTVDGLPHHGGDRHAALFGHGDEPGVTVSVQQDLKAVTRGMCIHWHV
jgi:hypothetical protein